MGVGIPVSYTHLMTALVVGHTAVLAVIAIGLGVAAFFAYSQDEAVSEVTDFWNSVKSVLAQVSAFFKRFVSPRQSETASVQTEEICTLPPVTAGSISVSV